MKKQREDLSGRKFGELIVLQQCEDIINTKGYKIPCWLCKCSCGNITKVRHYNLTNNKTLSCGCLVSKRTKEVCRKGNMYDLSGEYGIGYTNNTNEPFYFDLEDYEKLRKLCWYSEHNGKRLSAALPESHIKVSMHKFLGYSGFDHINRNEFDNRKENLRYCSQKENTRNRSIPNNNTSGFIGVRFAKNVQKWQAYIGFDGKQLNLGYYQEKEQAITARLKAEKELFKEFSPQKHLFKEYKII